MSRIASLFLAALLLCLPGPAWAKARVVATVPTLAAIAREVGGANVEVTSLSLPTQDPHFVDARPNLALELSKADLLLVVGLELEAGWLPTLLTGARNSKIQVGGTGYLDCSQFVRVLDTATGQVSRAQGDIHPGGNPHYLYDPRLAVAVVSGVAARLSQIDPANAAAYNTNAAAFTNALVRSIGGWEAKVAGLRGAPLITYHKSWVYLQNWLGFQVVAEIEPKPGIPPTPAHVASVLQTAKDRGVKLILQESYYPATASEQVARLAGATVVSLPGGPDFRSGQTYIQYMDGLIARLAGG